MSLHDDVWRLPGPATFVHDVVRAAAGRHVAAILPRALAADDDLGDALATALVDALPRGRRLQPWAADGPLTRALGAQLTYDDPPVVVRELVMHPDVVDRTLVLLASDLEEPHRAELPELVRRLEAESRSLPVTERGSFVVVGDRTRLPAFAGMERSETALASVWFWDRVSRWDVAALVAQRADDTTSGVLRDVRLETIVEVARWDLDLALRLSADWSGDTDELPALLGAAPADRDVPSLRGLRIDSRPPEHLLAAWDDRAVDVWHGAVTVTPAGQATDVASLTRLIWSAHARVLLPWIEVRRHALQQVVEQRLGRDRWRAAVAELDPADPEGGEGEHLVEIGALKRIAIRRIGGADPRLRDSAVTLARARNDLAHLRPLPAARLQHLVGSCGWLE